MSILKSEYPIVIEEGNHTLTITAQVNQSKKIDSTIEIVKKNNKASTKKFSYELDYEYEIYEKANNHINEYMDLASKCDDLEAVYDFISISVELDTVKLEAKMKR